MDSPASARRRNAILAVLIFLFGVLNALGPIVLQGAGDSYASVCFVFAAAGGLVSQEALLAVYLAFGGQALKERLLISCALALIVPISFLFGLQLANAAPRSEQLLLMLSLGPISFGLILIPLALVRATIGRSILAEIRGRSRVHSTQFSLKYIMGVTAGIAILISILRLVVPPPESVPYYGAAPWLSLFVMTGASLTFCAALVVANVWLTLADENRHLWGPFLAMSLVLGPLVCVWIFGFIDVVDLTTKMTWYGFFFSYGVGVAFTSWAVLFVARLCGLRLEPSAAQAEAN